MTNTWEYSLKSGLDATFHAVNREKELLNTDIQAAKDFYLNTVRPVLAYAADIIKAQGFNATVNDESDGVSLVFETPSTREAHYRITVRRSASERGYKLTALAKLDYDIDEREYALKNFNNSAFLHTITKDVVAEDVSQVIKRIFVDYYKSAQP